MLAIDECFEGFGFTIQTFRPEVPYTERRRTWFANKVAAESRGRSFDDPPPRRNFVGSATFDHCVGDERDSGFVLELSMKTESGRPFTLFIEEDRMFPEDGHQGPNIEPSIAAQLAFWTAEMICHGTVEDLDGRAVGSGKWMKAWS